MDTLETMITAAIARRDATIAEVERQKEERRRLALQGFQQEMDEWFGTEFVELLGARFELSELSGHTMRFTYRGREYSLRTGDDKTLTRLDPREDGDDGPLPHSYVFLHWRNGVAENRDELLCALADLDAVEVPPRPARRSSTSEPEPEPTTEERLLAALRELISDETRRWAEY